MSLFNAEIEHDDHGRPEMVLYPNFERINTKAASYHIPLSDAWLYSEEHNPSFVENMKNLSRRIGKFFGLYHESDVLWLPPTREEISIMADIADTIHNHLGDLLRAPPKSRNRGRQIGEATTYVEGKRVTRPIHEFDGLDPDDVQERKVTFWEGDAPEDKKAIIVNG